MASRGEKLYSTLASVQYPNINRLSGDSLDWLYEEAEESVALLTWLTKSLTSESYLSQDQLESFQQIPPSEIITGGKILEDALESLQDEETSFSNEDLEQAISALESELGYQNECCTTLTNLKSQISDSERMTTLLLNQLHEEEERCRREGRKVQEAVLQTNSDLNSALDKLKKSVDDFLSEYEVSGSTNKSSNVHFHQIELDKMESKESELETKLGEMITTVFGNRFTQLGLASSNHNLTQDDNVLPEVLDLESKDLLELVRGRDRSEFQHLKSEIYRLRACFCKTENDRIHVTAKECGVIASINTLRQSVRNNKNNVLVQIPSELETESIVPSLKVETSKLDASIKSLVGRCINRYCHRVLITDYNVKHRRSAYIFEKMKLIRDELLQSRAREQLLDVLLVHEHDQINNILNQLTEADTLLKKRLRKRQGFKTGVENLRDESEGPQDGDEAGPGTVVNTQDFLFNNLHKLLRCAGHVDPVATYGGVEQSVSGLINLKHSLQCQILDDKKLEEERMRCIQSGMKQLTGLLQVDQFSPSRGVSLIPKEVSRGFSHLDKQIKDLEVKLKGILTDWEQAKADLKTRPYHRQQRQLWIEFLLKPELVPANVRAVQNRAK